MGVQWTTLVVRLLIMVSIIMPLVVSRSSFGAEIMGISPHSLKVIRGDKVTLRIAATGENLITEWWREGRIICRSLSCQIDTTNFTPGQSIIELAVEDNQGVALARFAISAADAPPLYIPKNLNPEIENSSARVASIPKGQWLIVERRGGISRTQPGQVKNIIQSAMFEGASEDAIYSVAAGAEAIVRRVGMPEQILVFPEAKFVFKNGRFELLWGRALWRVSPESVNNLSQIAVAGGQVDAVGPSLVGLEIGFLTKNESRAIVQNFQTKSMVIRCPEKTQDVVIGKGRAGAFTLTSELSCRGVDSETFNLDDSSAWASLWSPWWFADQMSAAVDRWRSDADWFRSPRPLSERLPAAEKLKSEGNCTDALDFLTARPSLESKSSEVLQVVGYCQFDIGMISKSLMTFAELERRNINTAWVAFMMGRAYQGLNRHDLALFWFGKARRRGYVPSSELGGYAVASAEEMKDGLEKLRWLEVMWRDEDGGAKNSINKLAYEQWFSQRSNGGTVNAAIYIDSQAVPLNTKASKPTPIRMKASRSPVFAIDGAWWSDYQLSRDVKMKLHGEHDLQTPTAPSLSFSSRSIHNVAADLKIGDHNGKNQNSVDRWQFLISGRFGVGFSGGDSQRDRYGWATEISRPAWKGFSLGFESDKYLDPSPGGADVIDLDLNRYTGEVDHSHLDQNVYMGFNSTLSDAKWAIQVGYGTVDYRSLEMDLYDHSQVKLDLNFEWPYSARWLLNGNARYLSRSFVDGGFEQLIRMNVAPAYRISPLWRIAMASSLEMRHVSTDVLSTWTRHIYGVEVRTDL